MRISDWSSDVCSSDLHARCVECGADVENHAVAGGAVMMALAQTVEQSGARQLRRQQTGQSADRAEQRRARIACPGPALVAVAVGDDADAIAHLGGVVQDPFEGAPGGMDLDRSLDASVMGALDVGVTDAAMREADDVLD